MAVFRCLFKDILLRPDKTFKAHYQFFPYGIYGRIGYLGKDLFEIVVKYLRLARKERVRGIVTHGPDGLFAVLCHRPYYHLHVLTGISECPQIRSHVKRPFRASGSRRDPFNRQHVILHPVPVRLLGDNRVLYLVVFNYAPFFSIDKEHLAGFEPARYFYIGRSYVLHSDFRGHNYETFFRHDITGWTQAVPVQHGAYISAVGERYSCRPVPWFHETRMVLIKIPQVFLHVFILFPCGRDQHHHHMRQRPAR